MVDYDEIRLRPVRAKIVAYLRGDYARTWIDGGKADFAPIM